MQNTVGYIGLGKMGSAMVEHMLELGIPTVVIDRSDDVIAQMQQKGAIPAHTYEELIQQLHEKNGKAIIWLMIKAGSPVDEVIFGYNDKGEKTNAPYLLEYLKEGDVVIDGGNSYFRDTIRRANLLKEKGIYLLDSGTSGGIAGARHGACLMVGGDKAVVDELNWFFSSLAQPEGWGYMGVAGSGHFVKMVHNAVEYGMMQSIAEGLDLLECGAQESLGNELDLREVLRVWNHGSIVTSYLTQITEKALREDQHLENIGDFVDDNGEGAWTLLEAIRSKIPFLTVAHALFIRYTTRKDESFAMKVVAAQRNQFGGHAVEKK